jgi:hypothetical protein
MRIHIDAKYYKVKNLGLVCFKLSRFCDELIQVRSYVEWEKDIVPQFHYSIFNFKLMKSAMNWSRTMFGLGLSFPFVDHHLSEISSISFNRCKKQIKNLILMGPLRTASLNPR